MKKGRSRLLWRTGAASRYRQGAMPLLSSPTPPSPVDCTLSLSASPWSLHQGENMCARSKMHPSHSLSLSLSLWSSNQQRAVLPIPKTRQTWQRPLACVLYMPPSVYASDFVSSCCRVSCFRLDEKFL